MSRLQRDRKRLSDDSLPNPHNKHPPPPEKKREKKESKNT